MLSIYQDHVSKPIMKSVTGDAGGSSTADVDEAEDYYGVSKKWKIKLSSIFPKNIKTSNI